MDAIKNSIQLLQSINTDSIRITVDYSDLITEYNELTPELSDATVKLLRESKPFIHNTSLEEGEHDKLNDINRSFMISAIHDEDGKNANTEKFVDIVLNRFLSDNPLGKLIHMIPFALDSREDFKKSISDLLNGEIILVGEECESIKGLTEYSLLCAFIDACNNHAYNAFEGDKDVIGSLEEKVELLELAKNVKIPLVESIEMEDESDPKDIESDECDLKDIDLDTLPIDELKDILIRGEKHDFRTSQSIYRVSVKHLFNTLEKYVACHIIVKYHEGEISLDDLVDVANGDSPDVIKEIENDTELLNDNSQKLYNFINSNYYKRNIDTDKCGLITFIDEATLNEITKHHGEDALEEVVESPVVTFNPTDPTYFEGLNQKFPVIEQSEIVGYKPPTKEEQEAIDGGVLRMLNGVKKIEIRKADNTDPSKISEEHGTPSQEFLESAKYSEHLTIKRLETDGWVFTYDDKGNPIKGRK